VTSSWFFLSTQNIELVALIQFSVNGLYENSPVKLLCPKHVEQLLEEK